MTTHRAPHAAPQAARAAAAQRVQRGAIARALAARVPRLAPTLDWQALDDAPPWLALEDHSLRLLRRRVGSVLLAPALRLWISAAKVNAARQTLGDDWWRRLLEHQPWPDWSSELAQRGDWPADAASTPDAVAAVLDEAGNAVLLATMPHGALRHAASQMLTVLSAAAAIEPTLAATSGPVPPRSLRSLPPEGAGPPSERPGGGPAAAEPIAMPQAQAQAVLALTFRLLRDEATAASNVAASEASNVDAGQASGRAASTDEPTREPTGKATREPAADEPPPAQAASR